MSPTFAWVARRTSRGAADTASRGDWRCRARRRPKRPPPSAAAPPKNPREPGPSTRKGRPPPSARPPGRRGAKRTRKNASSYLANCASIQPWRSARSRATDFDSAAAPPPGLANFSQPPFGSVASRSAKARASADARIGKPAWVSVMVAPMSPTLLAFHSPLRYASPRHELGRKHGWRYVGRASLRRFSRSSCSA